jgi:hypothetical protein
MCLRNNVLAKRWLVVFLVRYDNGIAPLRLEYLEAVIGSD